MGSITMSSITVFMDDVLHGIHKTEIFDYQENIINTIEKENRVIILKSRQIGISYILALYSLLNAIDGKRVIIASPSDRQSKNVLNYALTFLQHIQKTFPEIRPVANSRTELVLPGGGWIRSFPNSPEKMAGFTADIVLIDEAAKFLHGTDVDVLAALTPALSTTNGKLILVSTPYGQRGVFYDYWTSERGLRKEKIHWTESPMVSAEFIESERKMFDELTFRQEYEHEFIGETHTYFSYELIHTCVEESITYDKERETVIGIDIGRKSDFTAITVSQRCGDHINVVFFEKWQNKPFREQFLELCDIIDNFKPNRVAIDQTGIGMQIAEELSEKYHNVILPVTFTNKNKNEMMVELKRLFEIRAISIPNNKQIIGALHLIQRTQAGGSIKYASDRTDEYGHCDASWSLALCPLALESDKAGVVEAWL